jgi:hypothetical protein
VVLCALVGNGGTLDAISTCDACDLSLEFLLSERGSGNVLARMVAN